MIANQARPINRIGNSPDLFASHRRRMNQSRNYVRRLLILLSVASFSFTLWASLASFGTVIKANGQFAPDYISTELDIELPKTVDAASRGRIVLVNFKESEAFKKGAMLAKLDSTEFESRRDQLEIRNELLRNSISDLKTARRMAEQSHQRHQRLLESQKIEATERINREEYQRSAKLRLAQEQYKLAKSQSQRLERLWRESVSLTEKDAAKSNVLRLQKDREIHSQPVGRQAIETIKKEALLVNEKYKESQHRKASELNRLEKEIEQNEEEVRLLNLQIQSTEIHAPYDGVVVRLNLKKGNWAEAGQTIAQIAPDARLIFSARVRTNDVGSIQIGNPVDVYPVSFDFLAGEKLLGHVAQIMPVPVDLVFHDSRLQFYEVRIQLSDDEKDTHRIINGEYADCHIHSDHRFTLADRAIRHFSEDKSTLPIFSRATLLQNPSM